mgnify:CR=1 FL=1
MKTLKQFQEEATGYRKVKSPDEQRFVDKHNVETVPDKNGNGDEVFKASNVNKVDRKKHRKGYEPSEDESVYEQTEELDEMSSKMKMKLGLYNKKKKKMKEEADLQNQRYTEFEESIEGLSPRLQETMHYVHDRLNEENRDMFVAACQTEEGLEKMIAFAIENRGE